MRTRAEGLVGHRMFTPEIPAIQSQTTAGPDGSMPPPAGRANGDLVLPTLSHELGNLTELPRCGVVQYPMRT